MEDRTEAYWKAKITELEMRVEQLEKELAITQIVSGSKDEFYTIEEYAKIMKCCTATIYHNVKNNKIPAFKFGKSWRIPKTEVKSNVIK